MFVSVWHVEYLRGSLLQGELTLNFGVKLNESYGGECESNTPTLALNRV